MKNYFKLFTLLICIGVFSCSSSDDSPNNGGGGGGGLVAQATYIVTFEPNFTDVTHPIDYPTNAGFSKMIVVAHGSGTSIFSLGQVASDGLKQYAEDGNTAGLELELSSTELNPTNIKIGDDIGPSDDTDGVTLVITPNTTYISFISKISPSPDWFVAVDAQNLLNSDNTLVESIGFKLYPIDAGTDSGTTYTSPDEPEPGPVSTIVGLPFTDDPNGNMLPLGTLNLVKID